MSAKAYIAVLPVLIKEKIHEDAYKIYVSDALKIVGENTARYAGGGHLQIRYADIIDPVPEETRTAEEIIAQVKRAWG